MPLRLDMTGELPTHFLFRNPELRGAAAEFLREEDREPVIRKDLGTLKGKLSVADLADSLDLAAEHPDRKLLQIVPDALRHVRRVRNGDPIPSELISGQPSWSPSQPAINRATLAVWRVLQRVPMAQTMMEPDPGDVTDLGRVLPTLLKDLSVQEAEERAQGVILDLARTDRLRRAITGLQRTVGELAQYSAQHGQKSSGPAARNAALFLRAPVIWGTEQAVALDAVMADILNLLVHPEIREQKAWPLMRRLRILMLDCEPVFLRWQAAMALPNGMPPREVEEIHRLVAQRYKVFDPSVFDDRVADQEEYMD